MKVFKFLNQKHVNNDFDREVLPPFRRLAQKAPESGYPNSWVLTDYEIDLELVKTLTGFKNRLLRDIREISEFHDPNPLFLIYFKSDEDAMQQVKGILDIGGRILPEPDSKKTPIRFRDKNILQALFETWNSKERVSHLNLSIHETLLSSIQCVKDIPGAYIEIGVYKGGSALSALNYLRLAKSGRDACFVDTFSGFNYETAAKSWDTEWLGTHVLNSDSIITYQEVKQTLELARYPFELIKLDICKSEDWNKLPNKVALINIDVDMYEPTLASLKYAFRSLQVGGIILLEDTASTPRLYGARFAMYKFLESDYGKNFRHLALSTHDLLIRHQ